MSQVLCRAFTDSIRAPPPPQLVQHEFETSSLVDVDSPHVSSVPSDFESQPTKTSTQEERQSHERSDAERERAERSAAEAAEAAKQKAQEAKKTAQKKAEQAKDKTHQAAETTKEKAQHAAEATKEKAQHAAGVAKEKGIDAKERAQELSAEARDRAQRAGHDLNENRDNPVVVGNAVVIAAAGAALGFGAYRKYAAGELTWKVVGMWVGAVGVFSVADYWFSQ
ncbi:MAG: rho-type gtpase-activating 2 [Lasallia pustulata]|uniref:Rho-type gtpase-activating 2 n=1 Tax=Lasallia pustulata TaxID=136370 RepID=A0A5M8PE11_9LECA|nr:MAG: rho-type gtpase-activating 2 [Lasallia pustulata]